MFSMTGYGKGEVTKDNRTLVVELKTINNRHLDVNFKLPKSFSSFEESLRGLIAQYVTRGRVDVFANFKDLREMKKTATVDMELAKSYLTAKDMLAEEFGLKDDFSVANLLKFPDIIKIDMEDDDATFLKSLCQEALVSALQNLNDMRQKEGASLIANCLQKVDAIEVLVQKISAESENITKSFAEKLRSRIAELLDSVPVDENRLANELAFYADKMCIDEEIARLNSHIKQIRNLFASKSAEGRKLDFLLQEFNREANTICSKANNLTITEYGLALKCEIEKIREQIQNLE